MELRLKNIQTPFFKVSDFQLLTGQRLLIQGPSGSGKTTFLHLLAGLYRPTHGNVFWDGKSILNLSESVVSHFRKTKMSLVFQNLNLLNYLTATENVELCGASPSKAIECLNQVNLSEKMNCPTQQLSLGEQQRVAVARVLAQQSDVILADEPTSSLDDKNAEQVITLLMDNSKKRSVIVVSHDHRMTPFFDRIISVEDLLK